VAQHPRAFSTEPELNHCCYVTQICSSLCCILLVTKNQWALIKLVQGATEGKDSL